MLGHVVHTQRRNARVSVEQCDFSSSGQARHHGLQCHRRTCMGADEYDAEHALSNKPTFSQGHPRRIQEKGQFRKNPLGGNRSVNLHLSVIAWYCYTKQTY